MVNPSVAACTALTGLVPCGLERVVLRRRTGSGVVSDVPAAVAVGTRSQAQGRPPAADVEESFRERLGLGDEQSGQGRIERNAPVRPPPQQGGGCPRDISCGSNGSDEHCDGAATKGAGAETEQRSSPKEQAFSRVVEANR